MRAEVVVLDDLRDTNWSARIGLQEVRSRRALILTADTVWRIDLRRLLDLDDGADVWIPVSPSPRNVWRTPNLSVDRGNQVTSFGRPANHDLRRAQLGVGIYLINSVAAVLKGLERPGELDSTGLDPHGLRIKTYPKVDDFIDFGTNVGFLTLCKEVQSWPEFFGRRNRVLARARSKAAPEDRRLY